MRKVISLIFFSSLTVMFSGCASQQAPQQKTEMGNLLLAEPAPVNPRSQMAIARYNQILANASIPEEDRAELLYQRGMLYDSVGLGGLAQYDYSQALQLKPDMAEAYNSMGIHFVQQLDFIQAYEAFDSTLDIDPEYDFAFLNRGIALYYGGRADLAVDDLAKFQVKDQSDPFRVLWTYFAKHDVNAEEAQAYLLKASNELNQNHWAVKLVELFLGSASENDLLNSLIEGISSQKELTDRLCEAYFYLGKYHSALGNKGIASNYFKLALSTNVYDYVEHRYARIELNRLRQSTDAAE
ncbi:lipoprotein NlpI [Alteromonas confluentis]|uniref:Lipoprotein NlpI n=1 Tax=Alteromonas confluentis TaxID=1656094 RepID=A0A1E7ZE81_9ALTE|nr:lipoprotein NlpI [Alteromonas confluentis]OFC71764.1 lipoprotein NlpI [Alteromonas confluentis]